MCNATEPTKPKYFNCYLDSETIVNHLSDEQAGKLWKMLFAYSNRSEKQDISDCIVSMAFDVMAQQIDRDFEKYREKCEKNRANAYKRNRPLTTVSGGSQDKDKDKYNMSTSVDGGNAFDYQSVVNSFNSICVSLPTVQKLTDKRRKQMKSAKKILGEMSFEKLFRIVESSDFLTGRNGIWNCCCFDWILKPANLTKIIEGNYTNKQNTTADTQRNYEGDFWDE